MGGAFARPEYHLDLQFVPLNLPLVIFNVWDARPPPESPLDFAYNPGVAWWGANSAEVNRRTFLSP